MKTQRQIRPDMDEMVFEHRNKTYGAYVLRRKYADRLFKAMLTAGVLAFFALGGAQWANAGEPEKVMIDVYHPVTTLPPPPKQDEEKKKDEVTQARPKTPVQPPAADHTPGPALKEPVVVKEAKMDSVPPNAIAGGGIDSTKKSGPVGPIGPTGPVGDPQDSLASAGAPVPFPDVYPENKGLRPYLASNLRFPEVARSEGIEGTVVLSFVVDTLGEVQKLAVEKGVHPLLDKEAMRVARGMPKWVPARMKGRKVSFLFRLPVRFRLD